MHKWMNEIPAIPIYYPDNHKPSHGVWPWEVSLSSLFFPLSITPCTFLQWDACIHDCLPSHLIAGYDTSNIWCGLVHLGCSVFFLQNWDDNWDVSWLEGMALLHGGFRQSFFHLWMKTFDELSYGQQKLIMASSIMCISICFSVSGTVPGTCIGRLVSIVCGDRPLFCLLYGSLPPVPMVWLQAI